MDQLEKYHDLYETMSTSGDVTKMKIFGEAEKWAFKKVAESHPNLAEEWLSRLEAVEWNNYLTESEAGQIVSRLMNQDGSIGGTWTMEQIESAVSSLGGKVSCPPYYNRFALYVVMNMLASDHLASVTQFVTDSELPRFFYNLAVDKLKDIDRPEFVRPYFSL